MEVSMATDEMEQCTPESILQRSCKEFGEKEKEIAYHLHERTPISKDMVREYDEQLTHGQRIADKVAAFGGSWPFITIFCLIFFAWIALNSFLLIKISKEFDPYPYILLNLVLSMLGAIQAPIILMSQNRQDDKDRHRAQHDYEVNLKAELEIMALNEKIDRLREKQWNDLIAIQQKQIALIGQLREDLKRLSQPRS